MARLTLAFLLFSCRLLAGQAATAITQIWQK
jgi:hypothetical protein